MKRLILQALIVFSLVVVALKPTLSKDLQHLELLEELIANLVPPESGTYRNHTMPQFIGSRSFRNGRLYPFILEYDLKSWHDLLETIRRLYDFHELDMSVYPQQSRAINVVERCDTPDSRTLRSRFDIALFEGKPEPGVDSFSLWERPFLVELHVFREREAIDFIDLIREFKGKSHCLDLATEFYISMTPDIDPEGRRYLLMQFQPFFCPGQPANKQKTEILDFHHSISPEFTPKSPWDPDGAFRGALDQLLDVPRFERGWLAPEGTATTTIWLQELLGTTDPDGSPCWHFMGVAPNPKAVSAFVKELRNSGWYEKVSIDSMNSSYAPRIDRLLTYFRLAAKPIK